MAKKQELPAVKPEAVLPSLLGASPELLAQFEEVRENLESLESFRLPRIKATSEGFELVEGDEPITELVGTLIHTKKTNVYYDKPFNKRKPEPPTCFSNDAVLPDKSIAKPIHATCKGCPMAEFGTNAMKTGKACRNLKPFYILLSDTSIMPRQLTVTPTSLKAATQYLMDLTERGMAYKKVKTKIEAYKSDADDKFVKLKFSLVGKLDEQQVKNAEFLKGKWLPVMEAQVVDQGETEAQVAPQEPVTSKGEY